MHKNYTSAFVKNDIVLFAHYIAVTSENQPDVSVFLTQSCVSTSLLAPKILATSGWFLDVTAIEYIFCQHVPKKAKFRRQNSIFACYQRHFHAYCYGIRGRKPKNKWVQSTHPQRRAKGASEEASRALPSRKLRLLAGWPAASAAPASPDETHEAAGV